MVLFRVVYINSVGGVIFLDIGPYVALLSVWVDLGVVCVVVGLSVLS